jgi:hypothetical protein
VLGSGLGPALGGALEESASFSFTDLPGFPPSGVPGHEGRLVLGKLAGVPVASLMFCTQKSSLSIPLMTEMCWNVRVFGVCGVSVTVMNALNSCETTSAVMGEMTEVTR